MESNDRKCIFLQCPPLNIGVLLVAICYREVFVMKKILPLLTFIVVFSFSTMASAIGVISPEEIALGGISPGSTPAYVTSVYGDPTRSYYGYDGMGNYTLTYDYNNTFKVRFWQGDGGWFAYQVKTTANNGIKTPAGVRVGMPASVLSNVYGATPSYNDGGVTVKSYAGWGDNRYLVFRISNGKIKSIMAEFGE